MELDILYSAGTGYYEMQFKLSLGTGEKIVAKMIKAYCTTSGLHHQAAH